MISFDKARERRKAKIEAREKNPGPLIYVVNCRHPISKWPTPNWHYVGRNMTGNPLYMGSSLGNTQGSLNAYKQWLWQKIQDKDSSQYQELLRILGYSLKLDGISLGCWCAPRRCHGDIVKAAVEWMWNQGVRPVDVSS
jgi:hypothetical protein